MKESFGGMIAALRKEKGMTQLDLATKMGVTDKAVSKWERDLSFPDVASLPLLAEVLGVTVDELLQAKTKADESPLRERRRVWWISACAPSLLQWALRWWRSRFWGRSTRRRRSSCSASGSHASR